MLPAQQVEAAGAVASVLEAAHPDVADGPCKVSSCIQSVRKKSITLDEMCQSIPRMTLF